LDRIRAEVASIAEAQIEARPRCRDVNLRPTDFRRLTGFL